MPVHKDNGSIKSQIPPLSGFFFLNVTRLKNSNVSLRKCLYRNTLLWVIITLILQESLHLLQKFTYSMEEMVKNRFFIHEINKKDSESKPLPRQLPLRAVFTFKGTIL